MLRFLLILFLFSCCSTKKNLTPKDTRFNKPRDWIEVYRHEMRVAMDNDDSVAWHFFFWELLKEKSRVRKNP